jgi:hypothetical protein
MNESKTAGEVRSAAILPGPGHCLRSTRRSPGTVIDPLHLAATGSNILYGPAGSENSGTSGMKLTQQIPPSSPPAYYSISVFGGNCKLTVLNSDGSTTTSQGSALSGLATGELVNLGGSWYDANSGYSHCLGDDACVIFRDRLRSLGNLRVRTLLRLPIDVQWPCRRRASRQHRRRSRAIPG